MNPTIVIAALLPLGLFLRRARFSNVRHFADLIATFWHEMSHAITAVLTRGEVDSIRVEPGKTVRSIQGQDSYTYAYTASGVTAYRTTGGFRGFIVTSAGYAGPTLLAIAMAATWSMFGSTAFGWLWSIILVAFFLVSRGVFALGINLVSLLMVAVSIAPVSLSDTIPLFDHIRIFFPTLLISTLLVCGFKDSLENLYAMLRIRRGELPATGDSDTEIMASKTGIPAWLWSFGYVVLAVVGAFAIPAMLLWQPS